MIAVSDSSPLIVLSRARYLHLLREFYGEIVIPQEVYEEVVLAGAGLPGAEEVQGASWIRVHPDRREPSEAIKAVCGSLGPGERNAIYLAWVVAADLVLIDEARARRAARSAGLVVAGSVAVLELGARRGKVADLRTVYLGLLNQGIRFDLKLLNDSLGTLGLDRLSEPKK